ncbi:TIM barrel protein [Pelagibacterales bacterium SAG-MED06]|nr:TIM barrel protein [Pelagibacterales bacterium SAG-MED06]
MINLGFMQGRLSKTVNNKIQFFPHTNWENEFKTAKNIGLKYMEWTIDNHKFYKNPLMIPNKSKIVLKLKKKYRIKIHTVTADFFMEDAFFKKKNHKNFFKKFKLFLHNCKTFGIKIIIIPLVDKSSIKNKYQENLVINFFRNISYLLKKNKIQIAFESDYSPLKLKKFINNFDKILFGINYDIGNSAGLGYNYNEELNAYGNRIINVHIKDKSKDNHTVPLFSGKAMIFDVIRRLRRFYKGIYIIQSARSKYDHINMINNYYKIFKNV